MQLLICLDSKTALSRKSLNYFTEGGNEELNDKFKGKKGGKMNKEIKPDLDSNLGFITQ